MLCITCGVEVSSVFKHAIGKNICPACGNSIMDEETLALIEDIKTTITNEIKLREETVNKLALVILTQYNVEFRDNTQQNVVKKDITKKEVELEKVPKIAPPSIMKIIEDQNSNNIIKAEELIQNGISDDERGKIMEEVVRNRYAMVDQGVGSLNNSEEVISSLNNSEEVISTDLFSEGGINPVLEQGRLARLAKQKLALTGGGPGSFRRGS